MKSTRSVYTQQTTVAFAGEGEISLTSDVKADDGCAVRHGHVSRARGLAHTCLESALANVVECALGV